MPVGDVIDFTKILGDGSIAAVSFAILYFVLKYIKDLIESQRQDIAELKKEHAADVKQMIDQFARQLDNIEKNSNETQRETTNKVVSAVDGLKEQFRIQSEELRKSLREK